MSEAQAPAFGDDSDLNRDAAAPQEPEGMVGQTMASGSGPRASIGVYRLLEMLGQGGMGEVWLAEQKQPVRRRIALKLIKAGMDTREVVARFESERQALALMDHPAIAKVFEAGSTLQGRPYFVMEYVTGIPITSYCDKHQLTMRERLELFIHVCEGVQHAHQKAIVHRDLKPSNILVTEVDGKPAPKIIDFGVAKATSQRLTAETMFTRVGSILGTPDYMSPEQAGSTGEDIDTRSDVYSLGVVLYELLVGALPLDFRNLPLDQILLKLREQDTPPPSTRLRTLGGQSTPTAQNRQTDAPTLVRQLRGDLDAINLKALEKDRSRRYASPSELAADITRYLRNEPVVAHPPSVGYRARKYIRRHRIGVGIAAAGVILLASFAVAQAVELRRITHERDRADRITNFMTGMFKVSNPSEARGNKVTAREILDNASKDIGTELAHDPELQAQMMHVMGTVYENLGLYLHAEPLFTRAVQIRSGVLGPNHPDTLMSMSHLASTLHDEGHYAEAENLHRRVLDQQRRVLGPDHPDTLRSMNDLGNTLFEEARYAEAEKLLRRVVDAQRRVLGPENEPTLTTMVNLANVLDQEGHPAEAEKLDREVLGIQQRVLGPEHPETLATMLNLAAALGHEDRYVDSEDLLRQALDAKRRVLGPEHPDTLLSMNDLADALMHLGKWAEAEKLFGQAREMSRRVRGPDHPQTALITYNLACIAAHRGQNDQALALLREALDHGLDRGAELDMGKDTDLNSLHRDPRFAELVADARHRADVAGQAR